MKGKERHYIMTKGPTQECIKIVDRYTPNIRSATYIKQILTDIKGEIDSNTIRVGAFYTPYTSMHSLSRQKSIMKHWN